MQREVRKHPHRITRAFVSKIKKRLGVRDSRQYWNTTHYSLKLLRKFGRMKGLWRCHMIMAGIFDTALEGNVEVFKGFGSRAPQT